MLNFEFQAIFIFICIRYFVFANFQFYFSLSFKALPCKNKLRCFLNCFILKYFFTWWRGRPTMEGKTALGASSPAKPALHIPEPLSTTRAAASSSHILDELEGFWLCRMRLSQSTADLGLKSQSTEPSFYRFQVFTTSDAHPPLPLSHFLSKRAEKFTFSLFLLKWVWEEDFKCMTWKILLSFTFPLFTTKLLKHYLIFYLHTRIPNVIFNVRMM